MAFLQVNFHSEALGLQCSANVILPQARERAQGREIPTVYLLHGYSDDHTMWVRQTAIERYAAELAPEFAVVMPAVDRSFYSDMKRGNRYWTFVGEDLPRVMGSLFPLSSRREDTFAAGLSMGGYGAMKLALNYPERFLACASLSGVCDIAAHFGKLEASEDEAIHRSMLDTFGAREEFLRSENDLKWRAEQVARGDVIPKIYMCCGTDDFLYENNLGFLDHLKKLGLPVAWEATPGRAHTWDYWDEQIQKALKFFAEARMEHTMR